MQIFAQSSWGPTSKTYTIDAEPSTDIEQFKQLIWDKAGGDAGFHNPELIRVIFAGKQLENGRTLQECGVRPGSTVYIASRMRGGSRRKSRARKNRRNTRRRH